MRMVWDERKRLRNREPPPTGHGFDFADARDRFAWSTAQVSQTYPGRDGNPRFMAVGLLDGKLVALVFAPLGSEAISAISLRIASNRERKAYAARSQT